MGFDPNQPFQAQGGGFDPGKPFQAARGVPVRKMGADRQAETYRDAGEAGYSALNPIDLSQGQSRAGIRRGAYYRDREGNIRRNDNGDAGNPIIQPFAPARGAKRTAVGEINGTLANILRGTLVGDELSAGLGTVVDVASGKVKAPPLPGAMGQAFAAAYKKRLADQRIMEDDFSARRPAAAALSRGTGMVPTVFVPGATAPATTSRLGAATTGAVTGAVQGAASGLLDRGSLQERVGDARRGAAVGAVLGGGLGGALGGKKVPKPVKKPIPTAEDLRVKRGAAYQAADQAGVRYAPEAVDGLVASIGNRMEQARLSPMRHPKAASMVADIQGIRGTSPTLTELDQLRQVVRRDVASAPDEAERFFGQQIIDEIDKFIAGSPQVASGSAEEAASLIAAAREANTRFRKVQGVEQAVGRADLRASSTGSGGNIDNATRQNIRGLLERSKNLTPEERAAMELIVRGSPGQNLLRQIGKLSPEGNGLMQAAHLAAAVPTGGLSTIPALGGAIAKRTADRMTEQRVNDLLRLMAEGGGGAQAARRELESLAASDPALAGLIQRLARGAGAAGASANPPRRVPAAQ